ncbi:hypothetical protein GCM10025859_06090 [Alicyclobacillus fastidiosus]|nr:hypothetical protein GCM10025859_06090 [Alicyclobacillus fastidiosus]
MVKSNMPTNTTINPEYPMTVEDDNHSPMLPLKYEPTGIPMAISDPLIPMTLPWYSRGTNRCTDVCVRGGNPENTNPPNAIDR